MRAFLNELRRRKVFTVGAAYVVLAWLALHVAATVFPIYEAPPQVLKVFTVLLGLPPAVVLAWAYDLTPGGVVRTEPDTAGPPGDPASAENSTQRSDSAGIELPTGPSIAVLPFRNLSGDRSQDPFAQSLTHDVAIGLTRGSHLFVLGSSATDAADDPDRDPVRAGQLLGVSYLLSGNVQKSGGG